jgi:hypothetical protein
MVIPTGLAPVEAGKSAWAGVTAKFPSINEKNSRREIFLTVLTKINVPNLARD